MYASDYHIISFTSHWRRNKKQFLAVSRIIVRVFFSTVQRLNGKKLRLEKISMHPI
jgi:hypothetical protein